MTLHLNYAVVDKLPVENRTYLSTDRVICESDVEATNYPLEFWNSLTPSCMPLHKLKLKQGCIIMLLRNLDIRNGICNGTRLIVKHLHDHSIDAAVIHPHRKANEFSYPGSNLPQMTSTCLLF